METVSTFPMPNIGTRRLRRRETWLREQLVEVSGARWDVLAQSYVISGDHWTSRDHRPGYESPLWYLTAWLLEIQVYLDIDHVHQITNWGNYTFYKRAFFLFSKAFIFKS